MFMSFNKNGFSRFAPLSIFERALLCALVLTAAFSVTSFSAAAESVRNGCVRLHILAPSDSEADQELKLKVRDALLQSGSEIFSGSVTAGNAAEKLDSARAELTEKALAVIEGEGYSYPVDIRLCEEYFTTRSYGSFTMPAGKYTAIKVIIGEGKGQNWWCVMFPPLCLPGFFEQEALDCLTEDGASLITQSPKYEPRFKIIEWYEALANRIS